MFEYIGEMSKDYIYAVAPLLEDALMDRYFLVKINLCILIKKKFTVFFNKISCGSYKNCLIVETCSKSEYVQK